MDTAILEGFEGDIAIIEINGQTRDISRELIEGVAQEGDVLKWDGMKWNVDIEATKIRSERIRQLMGEVWED